MEAAKRNWADLPPDLFPLILKKHSDIYDFIHSRAVCKPWRSSISVSDLPPQFPWILKLGKGPDLEFYSIASKKIYTIHAPNASDKRLFGPAGGYMLARQIGNMDHFSLLNPINNREMLARQIGHMGNFSLLNPINNSKVRLPVLDGSPSSVSWINPQSFQSDGYILVTEEYSYKLAVCKLGNDKWDCIEGDKENRYFFYLKGLLFMVDGTHGVTKVMDIGSRKEVYVIPPPENEEIDEDSGEKYSKFLCNTPCLVESCGEILAVCYWHTYRMADYKFEIHRLEFGNGKAHPCWVKVSSIGDRILFFDFAVDRGFSLSANDFSGFKGNCIYFTNKVRRFGGGRGGVYVICMYDIENGSTSFIDSPFDRENAITWFIPTLNHI